jgi:hypothetical protein
LTSDCSGDRTFAVSAKNIGTQELKLKIVLSGGAKITVAKPQSGSGITRLIKAAQKQELVVSVNGQQVQLPHTVREENQRQKSNDYVARLRVTPNGEIQIETPREQIATDGESIIIFADDNLRNKTCGMCGDYDGEKVRCCAISSYDLHVIRWFRFYKCTF